MSRFLTLACLAAPLHALPLLSVNETGTELSHGHWCMAPALAKHARAITPPGAQFRGAFQDLTLWVEDSHKSHSVPDCAPIEQTHRHGNDGLWIVEFDDDKMMEEELAKINKAEGVQVVGTRARTIVINGGEAVPDALGYDACGMEKDLRIISVSDRPVRGPRPMSRKSKDYYMKLATTKRAEVELLLSRVERSELTGLISHMQEYESRNSFSGSNGLDQAADWAAEQFANYGFDVTRHTFRDDMTAQVVAELQGTEVGDFLPIVVVGAHYDSRGTQSTSPTQRAPGADDNGSGSAALVEMARVIHGLGMRFKHTLRLCLFTGEEQGLVGSRALASQYAAEGQNIIAMFNADMIGYKQPGTQITLGYMNRFADMDLTEVSRQIVATYVPNLPTGFTQACCSDQQAFFENGFPSVGFFETPSTSVVYPQYHTSDDLLEFLDEEQIELQAKATMASAAVYLEPDEITTLGVQHTDA